MTLCVSLFLGLCQLALTSSSLQPPLNTVDMRDSWDVCVDCECEYKYKTVTCSGKFFPKMPTFPNWTEVLNIIACHEPGLAAESFQGLKRLRILRFSGNDFLHLKSETFSSLTQLRAIDFSFNPIESLPQKTFINLPHLEYLNLSYTHLKDMADLRAENFHPNAVLKELNLQSTHLHIVSRDMELPPIKRLLMQDIALAYWRDEGFSFLEDVHRIRVNATVLEALNLTQCGTHISVNFTNLFKMTELHLSAAVLFEDNLKSILTLDRLEVLDLSFCSVNWNNNTVRRWAYAPLKLRFLDLSGVDLSHVDFPKYLPNLAVLSLRNNRLTSLQNLRNLPSLNSLDLSENYLHSFPGMKVYWKQLVKLDLSENKLKEIDSGSFDCCPNLEVLNLSHNEIYFLAPSIFLQLNCLENFILEGNLLETFDFLDAKVLRMLWLKGNKLNRLNLKSPHMDNLVMLDLSDNPELLVKSKECTKTGGVSNGSTQSPHSSSSSNLAQYQCWPLWMSDLTRLRNLDTLNLANTGLHAWPEEIFLGLKKLTDLDLSNNHLSSDTLALVFNHTGSFCIQTLNLSMNDLMNIDGILTYLSKDCLSTIDLSENFLQCKCSLFELKNHEDKLARFNASNYDCFTSTEQLTLNEYFDKFSSRCSTGPGNLVLAEHNGLLTGLLLIVLILGFVMLVAIYIRRTRLKRNKKLYDTHYTLLRARNDEAELDSPTTPVNV